MLPMVVRLPEMIKHHTPLCVNGLSDFLFIDLSGNALSLSFFEQEKSSLYKNGAKIENKDHGTLV